MSLARAEHVKSIFVGYGITPERVMTIGLGEENPVADNDLADGRRQNRRVELILYRARDRESANNDP
jgi:outer membrane protein OmpA-like peptidoglycan-associated protein